MPNQTALLKGLQAAGPGAALAAQSSAQQGQTLDQGSYSQHQQRLTAMGNAMSALTTQYPGGVPQDAASAAIDREVASGLIPAAMAQQAKANFTADPAQNSRIILQNHIANLNAQQGLLATLPAPTQQSTGGAVRTIDTNPLTNPTGPGSVGSTVPLTTSPETNAQMIPAIDPATGQPGIVPRSTLPGASGAAPGTVSPLGTGRPPAGSPLLNPKAPQPAGGAAAPAAGPSPTAPAGFTPTGLQPGTPEVMQGSAAHLVDARAQANTYQQRIQPIEGALGALSGADTGKGGETLNTIRAYTQDLTPAFIQRLLPSSLTDTNARVKYEEANKYLTAMQINAPGGARSDAGQAAAGAATPSVHISHEAATLVAQAALAQQRLTQAGTLAFNKTGQPAANYDTFMNTWNTNADPRAFIADKMTAAQRGQLVQQMGGINSPAYQKFKQSYQDGVSGGVMVQHAGQ